MLSGGAHLPDAARAGDQRRARRGSVNAAAPERSFHTAELFPMWVLPVATALELDADGRFEITLSQREQAGNWLPMGPATNVAGLFGARLSGEVPATNVAGTSTMTPLGCRSPQASKILLLMKGSLIGIYCQGKVGS